MFEFFNIFLPVVPNWNGQLIYDRPRRCNLGTTCVSDSFVRGCLPYFVSLATYLPEYHPDSMLLFQSKIITSQWDMCWGTHIV